MVDLIPAFSDVHCWMQQWKDYYKCVSKTHIDKRGVQLNYVQNPVPLFKDNMSVADCMPPSIAYCWLSKVTVTSNAGGVWQNTDRQLLLVASVLPWDKHCDRHRPIYPRSFVRGTATHQWSRAMRLSIHCGPKSHPFIKPPLAIARAA